MTSAVGHFQLGSEVEAQLKRGLCQAQESKFLLQITGRAQQPISEQQHFSISVVQFTSIPESPPTWGRYIYTIESNKYNYLY